MELILARMWRTEISTIGELYIDNNPERFSYTLEDRLRDGPKIYGKTAIPSGRYDVVINFSNRFQKYMPLLINVPGFEGIRIHSGNQSSQTDGCILVGFTKGENFIGESKKAYNILFAMMKKVEKKEKITILIID